MQNGHLSWITNFIWGIADDVLRDVYVRGKYRDVILPMTVIRRLDAVLEDTKDDVLRRKAQLDEAGLADQNEALCDAAGQSFYNISEYRLRDLQSRTKQQQLTDDFKAYLDGFSPNVQEVLEKFRFRNQIPTLAEADALGFLIEKFLDPEINLSPEPVYEASGRERLPGLDNHAMGTIFEELIRRFNEENNEEAGEHFTPRDVVTLMADLLFRPIEEDLQSSTYLLYDGACGTGGMLTVGEERLHTLAERQGKDVSVHLYGQEVNAETFAITKADLLLKGEGDEAENFEHGSTLAADAFPTRTFDFMLSNPPYGKSWKTDRKRMGGKKDLDDPRFVINHGGDEEFELITRSSDGQMMFLANKLAKMKDGPDAPLGSRIAEVHNGSSLFTGDAGQGESNIRQWILENDWLEAILALPLGMFYNTGIATYVWVLTNRKAEHRTGKVQLIDATDWHAPLRKNLGEKNCELGEEDRARIMDAYLSFEDTERSRIFPNEHFGYRKITVERPLRLKSQFTREAVEGLRFGTRCPAVRRAVFDEFGRDLYERFGAIKPDLIAFLDGEDGGNADEAPGASLTAYERRRVLDGSTWEDDRELYELGRTLRDLVGKELFEDHNVFRRRINAALDEAGIKTRKTERRAVWEAMSWRDQDAPPVIKKVYKQKAPDPLHGLYEIEMDGEKRVVRYENDTDLRDTERVPLLEDGGIEAFFRREVLAYVPDAWIAEEKTKTGYEISFNRVFYEPPELRALDAIRADIEALEDETEGLLDDVLVEEKAEVA